MRWDFIVITQFHLSHFQTLSASKMNQSLWKRLALATASLMVLLMGSMALLENRNRLFPRNLGLKDEVFCDEDCSCRTPGVDGSCFAVKGEILEYSCGVETSNRNCGNAPRCDDDGDCFSGRCMLCEFLGEGRCLPTACF